MMENDESQRIIRVARERQQVHLEMLDRLKAQIEKFFSERTWYQGKPLTMEILAKTMKTSPRYISAAISKKTKHTFYSLQNAYRIREAVKMLNDPHFKHLTLENLYRGLGFPTRQAFYAAFKKEVGMTYADYVKSMKNSDVLEK